jgi:p-methyltransferase
MDALNCVQKHRNGVDPQLTPFELPNLGPASLASFLQDRGYDVSVVNHFQKDQAQFDAILEDRPLSAAITTTYYTEHYALAEIVAHIRQRSPATVVIAGGPYIWSLFHSMTGLELNLQLKAIGADLYVVESRGEITLARALRTLSDPAFPISFVPNLAFFCDGGLVRTLAEPESNSLDEEGVNWEGLCIAATPSMYMRTARGCPFRCSFCNYPAMAGDHQVAGVEAVLQGLRWFAEHGVQRVLFTDDTFNVPLPRFKLLLRMICDERLNLQWISFLRCSNIDDEVLELMAASGCMAVYLGIESADERILKAMNKFADVKRYGDAIRKLHANGIVTFGSFIAGFPGETEDSISRTAEFLNEHPTTFFNVQLYYDDPLSPIQSRRAEYGMRGSHYGWSHATMDWRAASAHADALLLSSSQSLPLPLHSFSIWSIPYLMDQGFTMTQVQEFAQLALAAKRSAADGDAFEQERFVALATAALGPSLEICR